MEITLEDLIGLLLAVFGMGVSIGVFIGPIVGIIGAILVVLFRRRR